MDAIEALKTRRCVRAFTGQAVPREVIEDLIDCGRMAPSAINIQPWEFIVVTDPELLGRIADVTDYGQFIRDAHLCVVVVCRETKYYLEDGCAATENILLAARAHGLGACWVAGDKKPYAPKILQMVNVPQEYRLVSLVPVGFPAESPAKEKRPLADLLHWNRF